MLSDVWYSYIEKPFFIDTNTSFTLPIPSRYSKLDGNLWGGGGSGAKLGSSTGAAGGGGGGACVPFTIAIVTAASPISVIIGASKTGRTTAGSGSVGETSSISDANTTSYLNALGGGGGGKTSTTASGGGGGGSAGAGLTSSGNASALGGDPRNNTTDYSNSGFGGCNSQPGSSVLDIAFSHYGGMAGASASATDYTPSSQSVFGGPGGGSVSGTGSSSIASSSCYITQATGGLGNDSVSGDNGSGYGAGGGGTRTGTKAGDGAAGHIWLSGS
jgi:hypothetical protein